MTFIQLEGILELVKQGQVTPGHVSANMENGEVTFVIGGTRPLAEIKKTLEQHLPYVVNVTTVDDVREAEDRRKTNEAEFA